jgi:GTP cyclohydrolase I
MIPPLDSEVARSGVLRCPSHLVRVMDFLSHRAQTQERLHDQLSPAVIGVTIEPGHMCRRLRAEGAGARTVTSALP